MTEIMNLTAAREDLGYTIEELSKEIDIPLDELRRWEQDFSSCPVQRLVEMALEGIEARRAFETIGEEIRSIKVDDSVMRRANEYLEEVRQRELREMERARGLDIEKEIVVQMEPKKRAI